MNLHLTDTIQMPDHQLRRQVIELCNVEVVYEGL